MSKLDDIKSKVNHLSQIVDALKAYNQFIFDGYSHGAQPYLISEEKIVSTTNDLFDAAKTVLSK